MAEPSWADDAYDPTDYKRPTWASDLLDRLESTDD